MGKPKNKSQWQQILKEAENQGLTVERPGERFNADGSRKKGGKHIRITNPETGDFTYVSCTPSESRGLKNSIAAMRKLGFTWQGR